jgi:hypothetical protein
MLNALAPLIGTWELEARFPQLEGDPPAATAVFEWALDGRFVVQRTTVDLPQAPDTLSVIALNADGATFTQHYFDSRGVVRRYAMTLADGVWTLTRDRPDDTPLDFAQRYVGRFDPDGAAIRGAWEIAHDKVTFEKDFDLDYVRVS